MVKPGSVSVLFRPVAGTDLFEMESDRTQTWDRFGTEW
jgi:hypothetical protein